MLQYVGNNSGYRSSLDFEAWMKQNEPPVSYIDDQGRSEN